MVVGCVACKQYVVGGWCANHKAGQRGLRDGFMTHRFATASHNMIDEVRMLFAQHTGGAMMPSFRDRREGASCV